MFQQIAKAIDPDYALHKINVGMYIFYIATYVHIFI